MSADRTLSSLTLLEEEPWFPFFGGMVSLVGPYGLDYKGEVDRKMTPLTAMKSAKFDKNLVKNPGDMMLVLLHADGGGWRKRLRRESSVVM